MLYEDLQRARGRAAIHEGELLEGRITELQAPKQTTLAGAASSPQPKNKKPGRADAKSGTGFGGGGGKKKSKAKKKKKPWRELTAREKQTQHQAATLANDGCLRINGALRKSTAARVRACILREIENAAAAVAQDPTNIEAIHAQHGIDQERIHRCVINLPLRADKIQGFAAACNEVDSDFVEGTSSDPILDALYELLDPNDGALGPLYAELCGNDAPLYELCSLVTYPGSLRQSVHPDAAHQPNAPLYAAFVACQDITVDMGPTLFLPGTQKPTPQRAKFDNVGTRNEMIAEFSAPKLATLQAGDLAIFDMRTLHVGTANHPDRGSTRVLFNLTFRNPKADQPIGYEGSIRKPYFDMFTLANMQTELEKGKAKGNAFQEVA